MKIYVCHSCGYDYESELYAPLRTMQEHNFFFPHEGMNGEINTTEIIKNADLILAEVSFSGMGVGIELGRAEAFGKKVCCVYKEGTTPSKSLRFVTTYFATYTNSEELIKSISLFVSELD